MIIGFTGTRDGMSHKQLKALRAHFEECSRSASTLITEFHHGDCIGADVEANDIVRTFGIKTHGHPPTMSRYRAFSKCDVWFEPKGYLERNQDIVDACEVLIVAPRTNHEVQRSGTWATYRSAKRIGRGTIMLER